MTEYSERQLEAVTVARSIVYRQQANVLYFDNARFQHRQDWYTFLFHLAEKIMRPSDKKVQQRYSNAVKSITAYLKRQPVLDDLLKEYPDISDRDIDLKVLEQTILLWL